jgi:hypothetical protein
VNLPGGHIAGLPVEETIATFGPALLVAVGAALAGLRARWRRVCRAARSATSNYSGGGSEGSRDHSVAS